MCYALVQAVTSVSYRIFRTDYGHTEVAAHFGNGECGVGLSCLGADEDY